MGLLTLLSRPIAKWTVRRINAIHSKPFETQQKVFRHLIASAQNTVFGKAHHFDKINTYEDFKRYVPIRDYEGLKPYIEQIIAGQQDVLWPGKPIYFCKTSGTTSGVKYIPITKASMPYHIRAARNAILTYIYETGNTSFLAGKLLYLSGSPVLEKIGGIHCGRLSGIVNHHIPQYLRRNQLPSYKTNCIEDWEKKVETIVDETMHENLTLVSGIPPWVQMYFDKLLAKFPDKKVKDIFSQLSIYIYGGVNFEPYRQKLEQTIGKKIDAIETYPASEGFIAYQNSQQDNGLLLLLDGGIFYEFIPANEYFDSNPTRLSIEQVELGVNYAIVLNTNAGLWGYSIGDTVKFTSLKPYKIIVTGRIKHFTSAFGEHVIGEEVEYALQQAIASTTGVEVTEFHVAPQVNPSNGELPYHEWFIEFANPPKDLEAFRLTIDKALQSKNTYYKDLIQGHILQPLKITETQTGAFIDYMKQIGKLGGQNKVPRLANDRTIADQLKLK